MLLGSLYLETTSHLKETGIGFGFEVYDETHCVLIIYSMAEMGMSDKKH